MRDSTVALALAGLTFLLTVIWGGPLIAVLRRFKIGKQIRIDEPLDDRPYARRHPSTPPKAGPCLPRGL